MADDKPKKSGDISATTASTNDQIGSWRGDSSLRAKVMEANVKDKAKTSESSSESNGG